MLKATVSGFLADNALSHGAAIAYYTIFSLAPVLVIVIAVAGLVFGHDAAEWAIVGQLGGLMGDQAAATIQSAVRSASKHGAGITATVIGVITLIVAASGVFGEMQSSLNPIWNAAPRDSTLSRLVRARLASLGLVMTLGFLLLVLLTISAGLQAMGTWMGGVLPGWRILAQVLNVALSFALIALLFAAIYKVLPDKRIDWRDVSVGAVATALLFTAGKFLIGLYIGGSTVASSYGAAGALAVVLVWVYYSAQIFLLGAEFTKVYVETRGSHAFDPARRAENAAPAPATNTDIAANTDIPGSALSAPPATPEIADLRDRLQAERARGR